MTGLLRVSAVIDRINAAIGHAVSWLILLAVLVSAGNAVSRKAFSLSSNAWLELQWYLFSAVFLLAAAYALQRNDHIRIDILSNLMPKWLRNTIELFGHIFMLMPFAVLMVYESYSFVLTSWRQQEVSFNEGGLIVWPAKALVLAGFLLLAAQGISEIIKRIAIMRGLIPDPHQHHSSAEQLAAELASLPERRP